MFVVQAQDISIFKKSLEAANTPKDKARLMADIGEQYLLGQIYYDSAFYDTERSLQLAQKHQLDYAELRARFNLGYINNEVGKRDAAIGSYQKAITLIQKGTPPKTLGSAYNNIGGVYFEMGAYDKAIENYTQGLDWAIRLKDTSGQGVSYMNIGEAHYKLDNLNASKENLEKSKEILTDLGIEFSTIHLFYARTLVALEEIQAAKKEATLSLEI